MNGVITTRHVFFQAHLIVSGFGFRVWLRCVGKLLRHEKCTFLECAFCLSK